VWSLAQDRFDISSTFLFRYRIQGVAVFYFFSFNPTAIPSIPVLLSQSFSSIWSYNEFVLWFIAPI